MTKSTLPVGGYSVNSYVGCTHGCKYCYASFMKRFTGHTEPWGTFLDVKHWPAIKNPRKYAGQRVVIGSVTEEADAMSVGEKRARAIDDFLASLQAQREVLGIPPAASPQEFSDEYWDNLFYEAKTERLAERGLW